MADELGNFEKALNDLRAAYNAASGNPSAQAVIKSKFDEVVKQKNIYILGNLAQRAAELNAFNRTLEEAIAFIRAHVANFPLSGLQSIAANATLPSDGEPTEAEDLTANDTGGAGVWVQPRQDPVPHGSLFPVAVSEPDFDALCRVAKSEVGHFKKYGAEQFRGGLGAVVDTIINRVAHKSFPDSVEAVVNQPFQFSAINDLGSWKLLPAAGQEIVDVIRKHVAARLAGGPCSVRGATHFLNPYLSSANALATWGDFVVDNAVAVFGNDAAKDVHYHGFAPNTPLPRDYLLTHAGKSKAFSGDGKPLEAAADATTFLAKLLAFCEAEWAFFERGSRKEADDPQYLRVGKYWEALGLPYNGQTKIKNSAGKFENPAWSAAFISYVVKNAGGVDRFKYAQAHCHYVQDFITGRPNALYEAMHPDFYAPKIGDILHFGRGSAAGFDFQQARSFYQADSFYASHSDIVVSVDSAARKLLTVGGNVGNSVSQKKFGLKPDGKLEPRVEDGKKLPWVAVLRLID